MSWKTVKNRIMSHSCTSQTWQSEQKSLLFVIEKAKLLNCDSANAERATVSNFRTIAPKAYRAAFNNQPAELDRLFQMATEYSYTDLRIALGKRRESIRVHKNDRQVTIIVDEYQAGVIANVMRDRYVFEMEKPILLPLTEWKISKYLRGEIGTDDEISEEGISPLPTSEGDNVHPMHKNDGDCSTADNPSYLF